ncbi:MAG: S41 family peptidase [Prevotella sp.]|nr:S41 family peptidase [Prevotella sp.]
MRKTIFLILSLSVSLCAAAQKLTFNTGAIGKLQVAEAAVKSLYVDSVDEEKLVEDAIRGMLKELDPHSSYTTAKETKSFTEPLQGSFEGIGVQFNMAQDTLLVIQTVSDGPSEKAGILAGDRIVSVNDTAIAGVKMSREDIMSRLRGKKGTTVDLKIVRRGIADTLTFKVKRDKIPVTTVDAAYMITPRIGYVRLGSFGMTTYDEFIQCVDSLRQHGMKDLIIDLQENGGGFLQSAVQIANEFLDKDALIVYTEGRTTPRQDFCADGKGRLRDGKVAVLVNEYSASAAEILSGALQDQDRGVIVGRRSFGKGLVQRPIEFDDGSMIRLTVAHYYTPSGRCIQKPYEKGDAEDYGQDIEKRFRHGELYSADSIHFADSLKYQTLVEHRTVYGGGGIMPDCFVPLDTTQYTSYHRQLAARGLVINASLKYTDENRKALKAEYRDADDFEARFTVPASMLDNIFADADTMKVTPRDDAEREATIPMLSLQLKALIARDLWDMTAYFKILNTASRVVECALDVLEGRKE